MRPHLSAQLNVLIISIARDNPDLPKEQLVVSLGMWKNINFERCLSYIKGDKGLAYIRRDLVPAKDSDGHVGSTTDADKPGATGWKLDPAAKPSITISRQCGAGGRTVASQLVDFLQPRTLAERQWTIFDKNLIEKVLEDHHLSKALAEYLPEASKSFLTETIERTRGLHPPTPTLVAKVVETARRLAANGYVILVGRATSVITEKQDNVFHVRLVGSKEKRIARVEEVYDMGGTEARRFMEAEDEAKRRYMKAYFDRDIEDPLLYHMTINTDEISYENAARLIGEAVIIAANWRQKPGSSPS